ncbi:TMEM175 family protein [Herbiconiux daphne]|uniref:TMEM175 family protein n=1 Tax=Herbiconiux daphne TaxID=2970914 RepID=A0ABT2GVY4_9MICO|nr:TMEM175 family protein [Herbiconiux daphne]MCS5732128.1 TMEM175 family protein [Herbiconiux daphne]
MRTERGFDRLVNFSDAVVAIAITLLILPLVDTATELKGMTVIELLQNDGLKLLVFVISFAVIGRFWLAHHQMYERVVGYNMPMLWVNLLWLLSIVFLPFPTELIASTGYDSATTSALYVGTMVLTSAAATWQMAIILRNPDLQAPAARGQLTLQPSLVSLGLMLAAFVFVLLFPRLGLWWLLLLVLSGPVQLLVRRIRPQTSAPAA